MAGQGNGDTAAAGADVQNAPRLRPARQRLRHQGFRVVAGDQHIRGDLELQAVELLGAEDVLERFAASAPAGYQGAKRRQLAIVERFVEIEVEPDPVQAGGGAQAATPLRGGRFRCLWR